MLLEHDRLDTTTMSPTGHRGLTRGSMGNLQSVKAEAVYFRSGESTRSPSSDGAPRNAGDSRAPISDGIRILEQVVPIASLDLARFHHLEIKSRLEVLQSWEGVVLSIDYDGGAFKARLHDLTDRNADESEADFDIRDVSANDRDLLRSGGIFQWMIGYRKHSFGQMERVSAIVFRRLPSWYEEDIENARKEGEELAASFSAD